jgi:hypothetical protein
MPVEIHDQPDTSHDAIAEALKQAAISIGKKGLMEFLSRKLMSIVAGKIYERLVGAIWWVVSPVVSMCLGWLVVYLVKETEFGLFFWYIDMRTNQQGKDFVAAAIVNRHAQIHGTKEEKANAEKRLRETFYAFASLRS